MKDVDVEFLPEEGKHFVSISEAVSAEFAAVLESPDDMLYATYYTPDEARELAEKLVRAAAVAEALREAGVTAEGGDA